jgi:hypothetical protein
MSIIYGFFNHHLIGQCSTICIQNIAAGGANFAAFEIEFEFPGAQFHLCYGILERDCRASVFL